MGAFAKLEALKEIRHKTISLEKTRVALLCDVSQMEEEERCLNEYRRELELLQQEKMAHVEELRQIHADINAMESIIKQSEDSRRNAQDNARKLLSEYVPLKQDVNRMRTDLLDLEKLPEISDEERDRLKTAGVLEKDKSLVEPWPHPPREPDKPPSVSSMLQPPPMKSCLSCHQQIHRNAPICPLCKAKSRSRNPKKPKKKEERS